MTDRRLFLAAWLITGGFITWQEITVCHDWPWPPRYIFAALTYGVLDLLSTVVGDVAGVVAIGMTLSFIIQTFTPKGAGKGFAKPNCNHVGTSQPASYKYLALGAV